MTEQQRDELLISMKDQMDKITSKLAEHDEQFKAINKKLAEHDEQFEVINGKLAEHDEKFETVDGKFDEIRKELRNISKSVAVIEIEHGSKIQALLDVQVGILERLDSLETRLGSDEAELEEHSGRIWNLESKVGII